MLRHSAKMAFKEVPAITFGLVLQHLGIAKPAKGSTKSPQKIFEAMHAALPQWTEEQLLRAMFAHAARMPKQPASQVLDTDELAAVLEEKDWQEVAEHQVHAEDEHKAAKAEAETASTYIKKRLSALARQRASQSLRAQPASGSSHRQPASGGSHRQRPAGPLPAAAGSSRSATGAMYRENLLGAWTVDEVSPFLPSTEYRAVRDPVNGRWYVSNKLHPERGVCSRSWLRRRTEAQCVQMVLRWAWTLEAELLGEQRLEDVCPFPWVLDDQAVT